MTTLRLTAVGGIGGHCSFTISQRYLDPEINTFRVEVARETGIDAAIMSDRLIRKLDMPTDEEAAESAAEVFTTRYSGG